ncbi:MAG: guanylate kinase [Thermodesulfobacteriota bacterium]
MEGTPFILSAPSGAGKTTLRRMAVDFFPDLRHSVSYTTRKPRPGETDGVDYRFVDEGVFDGMEARGEFIENAEVHGKRYGTSEKDLKTFLAEGLDVILDIDVQGAERIRGRLADAVYIFVLPPSVEACRERLRGRGKDAPEDIEKRLEASIGEIKRAGGYDYIIINDDLDKAFGELKAIVAAERAREKRRAAKVKELFNV